MNTDNQTQAAQAEGQKIGLQLKAAARQAKIDFYNGRIDQAAYYRALDAYIVAIRAAEKKIKGRASHYSRAKVERNI